MDHYPRKSIAALKSEHPVLKHHCDFKPLYATAEHIREQLLAHHLNPDTPPIICAYVTAHEDRQAFYTALKLRDQPHRLHPPVPVVLALSRPGGVADLVDDTRRFGALDGLKVFATMAIAARSTWCKAARLSRWPRQSTSAGVPRKPRRKSQPRHGTPSTSPASSPAVRKRATSPSS